MIIPIIKLSEPKIYHVFGFSFYECKEFPAEDFFNIHLLPRFENSIVNPQCILINKSFCQIFIDRQEKIIGFKYLTDKKGLFWYYIEE